MKWRRRLRGTCGHRSWRAAAEWVAVGDGWREGGREDGDRHVTPRTFMSFTFNWPRFSDQFHYDAIQMLNNALNKGNKPPVIADKIEVVELEMGTEVRPHHPFRPP